MPPNKPGVLFLACLLFAAVVQAAELRHVRQNGLRLRPTVCRSATPPGAAQQYWQQIHSANFTVCCPRSFDGEAAARICEALRLSLSEKWLGAAVDDWSSRCYVVLHPTAITYVQSAGRGSEQTAGCSTVKEMNGYVLSRRIDLRLDRPDPLSRTLPHELTHVVLADAIVGNKLPRWADEGMAMLADPQDKREGHRCDLVAALNRGAALRLPAMLTMDGYPEPHQIATFYGQSLSLVEFLIQRKGSLTLQQFLVRAVEVGYERALDETYGIQSVNELERLWLANIDRAAPQRESLN